MNINERNAMTTVDLIGYRSPIGRRCWYTRYPHIAGTVRGMYGPETVYVAWDDREAAQYVPANELTVDWSTEPESIDVEPEF
jgi:hypothetical protein